MSNLTAEASELIARLRWGQPALTIVDLRDRPTYNHHRITGAISIPLGNLTERAKSSIHQDRQIYVYGENDMHATQGANILESAGFRNVGIISGGLPAWKTFGGPTEGFKP
ncbi:rhodanese-like domain-containing protein [Cylindrospermopsis raciborskii]|uniref:rhodanese-like domain-containing protein n=1 Tax=Cylindrospermopsis raciborskii TaxID=77022 RepID=UPI0038D1D609